MTNRTPAEIMTDATDATFMEIYDAIEAKAASVGADIYDGAFCQVIQDIEGYSVECQCIQGEYDDDPAFPEAAALKQRILADRW